jgi:hypothetical protein
MGKIKSDMAEIVRMNYFCTYCDRWYAARLICLYESLVAQGEDFHLSVLCFDADTEAVVSAQMADNFLAIPLGALLAADSDYAAVRGRRTAVEFYFTATPVLVRYCLNRQPDSRQMTYLDSDLFFFAPTSAIFREQGNAAVGIVSHRFPPRLAELSKWGTYNVAWVSFRRDQDGLACLEWWRERCLEWCHDYIDQGRFADQGYLDEFPQRFARVHVLNHSGINAAPWNMDGVQVIEKQDQIHVNGGRLLFYHFQGIRELLPGWFESGFRSYRANLSEEMRELIYLPYLKKLSAVQVGLRVKHGIGTRLGYQRLPSGKSWQERWRRFVARWVWPRYRRFRGQLLHCPEPDIIRLSHRNENRTDAVPTVRDE